jgi:hypothetical protein
VRVVSPSQPDLDGKVVWLVSYNVAGRTIQPHGPAGFDPEPVPLVASTAFLSADDGTWLTTINIGPPSGT